MGKRFLFGICLFLILPIFGLFVSHYLHSTQFSLHKNMEKVSYFITNENISSAQDRIKIVKKAWIDQNKIIYSISSHNISEQIRQEFSRLDAQLSSREYSHAAETSRILSVLFHALGSEQLPVWWNIL